MTPAQRWQMFHARTLCTVADTAAELAHITHLADGLEGGCSCRHHWKAYVAANPPDVSSPAAYWWWGYRAHDDVSRRLGKPRLTAAAAAATMGTVLPPEPSAPAAGRPPGIDRAYVINLRRRPDRWRDFWKTAPPLWPHPTPRRVEAADGRTLAGLPGTWEGGPGAYACKVSHLTALRRAMTEQVDCVVVYEDDVSLPPDYALRLTRWLAHVPDDWQALWVGNQNLDDAIAINAHVVRPLKPHRMHAYVLRGRDVIRRTFWKMAQADTHIDHYLGRWLASTWNSYAPTLPLACQKEGTSDIGSAAERRCWEGVTIARKPVYPGRNTVRTVEGPAGPITVTRVGGLTTPSAFNGALLPDGDRYLLAYRPRMNRGLGYALLDGQLNVRPGTAREIELVRNEDPRLVRDADGSVLMSTNYWENEYANNRMELRRMTLAETAGHVRLDETRHLGKFETIRSWPGYVRPTEKNWTPFVDGVGVLRLVYSIRPHRVLTYDRVTRGLTLTDAVNWPLPAWWRAEWGTDLRGSSPPAWLGDRWLSTWHTVTPGGYFTGFYTFAAAAPFRPLAVTAPVLLPTMATGRNVVVPSRQGVVFVNGLVVEGDRLLLSGGDNDHSVVVIELSLERSARLFGPRTGVSVTAPR